MKLYNPFSWHIAKNCNNQYVVRKFSLKLLGWRYLDRENLAKSWSIDAFVYEYCVVDSLEKAEKLLKLDREVKKFKAI